MRYYSTNHQAPMATLEEAVVNGLAPDRGLYMPETIHRLPDEFFKGIEHLRFQDIACVVADAFFGEDVEQDALHEIVWGGQRLTAWKGFAVKDHIGESWEVSCVESSPSVIANGPWAGDTLSEVIKRYPEDILGSEVCRRYDGQLPILVKFIDAKADLSIQVHPDRRRHISGRWKTAPS